MSSLIPTIEKHAVIRKVSEDGRVVAILYEVGVNSTVEYSYEVFVKYKKEEIAVAKLHGAVRSKKSLGANIVWADSNLLEIQFLRAFGEEIYLNKLETPDGDYLISLVSGVEDEKAPPGGMKYNLEHN